MSTIVLLTALDLEYQALRQYLTGVRAWRHPAGTVFESGQLRDAPGTIALAVTGEGNGSAAVLAERAVAAFRPKALLCVGIAGGLKDEIALGDVLVGTRIYALHSGRAHDDGFSPRPMAWPASHELEQLARQVARGRQWDRLPPAVHFKPIVSGEVVITGTGTSLTALLKATYDDAGAVDMESAGFAQAAHLNQSLPALSVRGISDKADASKGSTDASGWQVTAAGHAAAFAVSLAALVLREAVPAGAGPDNHWSSQCGQLPSGSRPAVASRGQPRCRLSSRVA
jgi:adenosylhomocysteine nucleosidase